MMHFDEKIKLRARTEDCPVPEGFDERLEAVLEGLPQHSTAHKPRHLARKAIAAAAAVCLLAGLGTSLAVASERTVDPLSTTLETWAKTDLATPIGVSDSSWGWTVTVDSVLGDSWYTYILCTLSKDNGQTIVPGEYGFHDWNLGISGLSHTIGIHWLADDDLTDNKLPFGIYLSNYNEWDLNGQTLHMTLDGLSTAELAETWTLMAGGAKWELEFTLPAESAAENFSPALSFEMDGQQATLDLLRVSPMGVWAEFSGPEGVFDCLNPILHAVDLNYVPRLLLADGTVLSQGEGGGAGDGSSYHTAYSVRERTITPADIAGLQIGETVYPLALIT